MGTLLRTVLVVVLVPETYAKHKCNYKDILASYTGVISVELQHLVRKLRLREIEPRSLRDGRLQREPSNVPAERRRVSTDTA